MIKTFIKIFLMSIVILTSSKAYSEYDLASVDVNLSLNVQSLPSFGFQRQFSKNTAITFEYGVASTTTIGKGNLGSAFGASYKKYTSTYHDGLYYRLGLALFNKDDATEAILPIAAFGYETYITDRIVMGAELGEGTTAGVNNITVRLTALY